MFATGSVITSTWLNSVDRRQRATVSLWDFLSEEELQAVRSGARTHDVTAAFQACNDFCTNAGCTMYMPAGVYILNNIFFGNDNPSGPANGPKALVGDGQGTVLMPRGGVTGTFLSARNLAGITLRDFVIDGNNESCVLLDTSWTLGNGPSIQNTYQNIWIQNYNGPSGWRARGSNDCTFLHCMVRQPGPQAQLSFEVPSPGGMLTLQECYWYHLPIGVAGQNINLVNCAGHGVRTVDSDFNALRIDGCYLYSHSSQLSIFDGTRFAFQSILSRNSHLDLADSHTLFHGTLGITLAIEGGTLLRSTPTGAPGLLSGTSQNQSGPFRAVVSILGTNIRDVDVGAVNTDRFHLNIANTSGVSGTDEPLAQWSVGRNLHTQIRSTAIHIGVERVLGGATVSHHVIDAAPGQWTLLQSFARGAVTLHVMGTQPGAPAAVFAITRVDGRAQVAVQSSLVGSDAYAGIQLEARGDNGVEVRLSGGSTNAYLKCLVSAVTG